MYGAHFPPPVEINCGLSYVCQPALVFFTRSLLHSQPSGLKELLANEIAVGIKIFIVSFQTTEPSLIPRIFLIVSATMVHVNPASMIMWVLKMYTIFSYLSFLGNLFFLAQIFA